MAGTFLGEWKRVARNEAKKQKNRKSVLHKTGKLYETHNC